MSRIELLQQESSHISLHDDERKQLRDSLLSYMEKTPIHEPVHDTEDPERPIHSPYFKSKGMLLAVILGLIVATTGISFAAEQALPGDMLYPIKRGLNEKVKSYVSFSNTNKVELEARLAERRLEEAEKLQARSKLDAKTYEDLKANYQSHVSNFEAQVEKLKGVDVSAAAKTQEKFDASAKTHAAIYTTFTSKSETIIDIDAKNNNSIIATSSSEIYSSSSSMINGEVTPKIPKASTTSELTNEIKAKVKVPDIKVP